MPVHGSVLLYGSEDFGVGLVFVFVLLDCIYQLKNGKCQKYLYVTSMLLIMVHSRPTCLVKWWMSVEHEHWSNHIAFGFRQYWPLIEPRQLADWCNTLFDAMWAILHEKPPCLVNRPTTRGATRAIIERYHGIIALLTWGEGRLEESASRKIVDWDLRRKPPLSLTILEMTQKST